MKPKLYITEVSFSRLDPVDNEKIAVVQSALTVVAPADFTVRYKAFNYKGEPAIQPEKNNKIYRWEIKHFDAIELEYAYPSWDYIVPMVYLAPAKFQLEKYTGEMSTWQGFGEFMYTLNAGRDKLPDDVKQTVHQLTAGVGDVKQKISILYKYMQQNTRYISVQLGIGGWQTFDANYVATKKYGDCKALSNYMYSLLKEAGIKSCYTLVKAGRNSNYLREDFPSNQFNHAILCVPLQKDTVWLECTSQTLPSGYLSSFTANRPVLIIDETGGKLVRTPKYTISQNVQSRKTIGTIAEDGQLTTKINTTYKAIEQDNLHHLINDLSHEKQLEYLKEQIDLPHYDVTRFEYKEDKSALPEIDEELEIKALNYASITGKRLFVYPNVISRFSSKLKADDTRKYPVSIKNEYTEVDTTEIALPPGYQSEALPAPVKIESRFGKYISSVEMKSDKLFYYRRYENFSGEYPASDYNDFVKFYDQIYKADRSRVVLVKKE
ncbi:MAG: transglutaminase domain-containing protein [Agriterribacter sp.]